MKLKAPAADTRIELRYRGTTEQSILAARLRTRQA